MRYRVSRWVPVGGLALVAVSAGAVWGYGWLVRPHEGITSGERFLVFAFGPMLVGMVCQGVWTGARMLWRGMTVYGVTPEGLEVHTPAGRRRVRKEGVRDFSLLPGTFPGRPDRLVLHMTDGRSVRVPLKVRDADQFRQELMLVFERLGAEGMERVRYAGTVPSLKGTRWRRNTSDVLGVYAAAFVFLLFTVGGVAMGWDYVGYWRIRAGHETAVGKVVEVEPGAGDETTSVTVRYTPRGGGEEVRLYRQVLATFSQAKGVGDPVTVEYLPGHPRVARIQGWDMDGRDWLFALIAVLGAGMGAVALKRYGAAWVMPLRVTSRWKGTVEGGDCRVEVSPDRLAWAREAFAEWHEGAVVFGRIVEKRNGARVDRNRARAMEKAGLSVRRVAGGSVAVGREEAARLWERLGMRPDISADYRVLQEGSVAEAERVGLRQAAAGDGAEETREVIRFASQRGRLGPIERGAAAEAFDRWVDAQVRELYEFVAPAEVRRAAFARVLRLNPADGEYRLLVERTKDGPRVWVRRADEATASRAEWREGSWQVAAGVDAPGPLRKRRGLPQWLWLFGLPVALVFVLIILPFYPLLAWDRRRRRREALQQLAGGGTGEAG